MRRLTVAAAALCVACGGAGVEGRYTGQGETFFDSLTFRSDGKVEIVFVGGKNEGAYQVDGSRVILTAPNGDQSALAIDSNGCLSHQLLGTSCRTASAAASPAPPAASGGFAEVYEATTREGRITMAFGAGKKVQLTMIPTGIADAPERMSFDVGYEVSGNEVAVSLPGSDRLRLTRRGDDLEGTMNGETVRFVKR